jgi:glycerol-3-phosphate acyltransferase PlsY
VTAALWILGSYLAGAIPTSYLAGRWGRGIDLREHGSRNLGATNVFRVLGWKYAVPVAVFDVAKGAAPVLLAEGIDFGERWLPLAAGVAAVVGHVFSVFVGFKGGKGVATAAGVVLASAPLALAGSAVVWAAVVGASGYVSLGSLIGAASFPVAVRVFQPHRPELFWAGVGLALFICYTHRANIRRLLRGSESRFGRRHRPAAGGA